MSLDQAIQDNIRAIFPELLDMLVDKLKAEKVIPAEEEKTYYQFEVLTLHLKDPDRWPSVSKKTLQNYVKDKKLPQYTDAAGKVFYKESELLTVLSQKGSRKK